MIDFPVYREVDERLYICSPVEDESSLASLMYLHMIFLKPTYGML